jgi:hypothetical protein
VTGAVAADQIEPIADASRALETVFARAGLARTSQVPANARLRIQRTGGTAEPVVAGLDAADPIRGAKAGFALGTFQTRFAELLARNTHTKEVRDIAASAGAVLITAKSVGAGTALAGTARTVGVASTDLARIVAADAGLRTGVVRFRALQRRNRNRHANPLATGNRTELTLSAL